TRDTHTGNRSLRIDWTGEAPQAFPLITQTVLVEPATRYRLSFAARARDVVTGGPPLVIVVDATSNQELTKSKPLPQDTTPWQDYSSDFTTSRSASAIIISVQRQTCTSGQCPIFGHTWLDDISLQKLSANSP
ncbi:MAG: carbohydrate binding domain-containing protein, partial [Pyrinomonadaceae bacterium]|nr:carbohydrate binding domain-containing protein [Pyrinomonadaceae bacterium]